jgi:hypothetical protein
MNIYHLKRKDNLHSHDIFYSAIVVAENEAEARLVHPKNWNEWHVDDYMADDAMYWPDPDELVVELLGIAAEHLIAGTVILADFAEG